MVLQDALELPFDDGPHIGRQIFFKRFLIALLRDVLALFAVGENCVVAAIADRGL